MQFLELPSYRLLALMNLDVATPKELVGAVVVSDHFAGVLVPDLEEAQENVRGPIMS